MFKKLDKCPIITKIASQYNQFRPMLIKPLIQLTELIENVLSSVANLSQHSS